MQACHLNGFDALHFLFQKRRRAWRSCESVTFSLGKPSGVEECQVRPRRYYLESLAQGMTLRVGSGDVAAVSVVA
jgi:hypothetical protein